MKSKRRSLNYFIILLLAAALSAPLLLNPALRTRSDAVVHIGITRAILRNGIPPSNPFLAGERLPYYWFYDALTALLCRVTRVDPGTLMALFNALGLLVLLLLIFKTVTLITGRAGNGLLAAGLAVFGMNGGGWLFLLPGISRQGLSSLEPILTGGVWAFLPHIVFTPWEGTMGFMLTKFWVANSFGPGLAAAAGTLYLLFNFLRKRKFLFLGGYFLAALLTSYLNIVAGASLIIPSLAYFSLQLIRRSSNRREALSGILATLLLLPFLLPYLASIAPESSCAPALIRLRLPGLSQLRMLAVILAPLWILAALTFKRPAEGLTRSVRQLLLIGIVILGIGFLFIRFPKHNEFKLIFPLALALSLFIGIGAELSRPRRSGIVWGILLASIPTTLLGWIAYSRAPDKQAITPDERAIYAWVEVNLPRDAVLISERRGDLIPLLSQRDAYLACYSFLKSIPVSRSLLRKRREKVRLLRRVKDKAKIYEEISRETGRPICLIRYSRAASPGTPITLPILHAAGKIEIRGNLSSSGGEAGRR